MQLNANPIDHSRLHTSQTLTTPHSAPMQPHRHIGRDHDGSYGGGGGGRRWLLRRHRWVAHTRGYGASPQIHAWAGGESGHFNGRLHPIIPLDLNALTSLPPLLTLPPTQTSRPGEKKRRRWTAPAGPRRGLERYSSRRRCSRCTGVGAGVPCCLAASPSPPTWRARAPSSWSTRAHRVTATVSLLRGYGSVVRVRVRVGRPPEATRGQSIHTSTC